MHIISSRTHTWIGIAVGVVLIAAPWILSFDEHLGPRAVAVSMGLFILLNEVLTTSPVSPMKIVPMRVHIWLDVAVGVFLAASPWLLRFHDHGITSWLPHLIFGVLVAGYALVTDTSDAGAAAGTAGMARITSR